MKLIINYHIWKFFKIEVTKSFAPTFNNSLYLFNIFLIIFLLKYANYPISLKTPELIIPFPPIFISKIFYNLFHSILSLTKFDKPKKMWELINPIWKWLIFHSSGGGLLREIRNIFFESEFNKINLLMKVNIINKKYAFINNINMYFFLI